MKRNDKGMTLVELLAVLTLFSVISILIFGLYQMGIRSYQRNVTTNMLQQDSDLVLSRLKTAFYHKNSRPFHISTTSDGKLMITYTRNNRTDVISGDDFIYSGTSTPQTIDQSTATIEMNYTVKPRDSQDQDKTFHLITSLNFPWKETEQKDELQ
ncbi:PulJ/GspJ family protein [Terrilactibacillus laevilacticus]|uniref:Type II secretion system protein J n=1 Tax=Terrilactibacillus laevilacticus TaxID=1380157 RepID=A0ABW5PTC0_9BACI|nr:prepilin-type N-terminal cleavage/methylation domain-containing protein [Terrilactibacillus laevilacticus]